MFITSRTLSKELRIIAKAEIHPGLFPGIFFEGGNDDLNVLCPAKLCFGSLSYDALICLQAPHR